jgi:hypothetical protein
MNTSKPNEQILEAGEREPIFVEDLGAIIPAGPITHLLFTLRQPSTCSGRIERILQVRLIVPTDAVREIGKAMLAGRLAMPLSSEEESERLEVTLQ